MLTALLRPRPRVDEQASVFAFPDKSDSNPPTPQEWVPGWLGESRTKSLKPGVYATVTASFDCATKQRLE